MWFQVDKQQELVHESLNILEFPWEYRCANNKGKQNNKIQKHTETNRGKILENKEYQFPSCSNILQVIVDGTQNHAQKFQLLQWSPMIYKDMFIHSQIFSCEFKIQLCQFVLFSMKWIPWNRQRHGFPANSGLQLDPCLSNTGLPELFSVDPFCSLCRFGFSTWPKETI